MRIGILSHYYRSRNYGGNFQAFALYKFLENNNFDALQISYDFQHNKGKSVSSYLSSGKGTFKTSLLFRKVINKIVNVLKKMIHYKINTLIQKREQEIDSFNKNIPHTTTVYNDYNIHLCNDDFDAFIAGSDQIWNFWWYREPFFLSFATNNKKKLSYAASMAQGKLTESQKETIKKFLEHFAAVSVREKEAADLIQPLYSAQVHWVLDPTFLLTKKEWDEVATDRVIPDEYIFCYFLGDKESHREIVKEFSAKHGKKIATIPYLSGMFRKCDKNFGDYQLFEVSPAKFISLIKYANIVFTDSFHGTCFSSIYTKEFISFGDFYNDGYNTRIGSITNLFKSEDHFCNTKEKCTIGYIEQLNPIDYKKSEEKVDQMRIFSQNFLLENLSV